MLPTLHILPQYGSISVPTLRHTYLVGSGQNAPPPVLETIGVFDTVLGTPPEVLQKDIRRFCARDILAGLAALNRVTAEDRRCEIDSSGDMMTLNARQGGLGISLYLRKDGLATTSYELTFSENHIKAFLKASLKHYAGALVPRGETLLEDRLLIAANLVYHQQYGKDEESFVRPPVPEFAKLVPEIEKNSDTDLADAVLAVRATDPDDSQRDLLCLSVNEEGVYTLVLNRLSTQTGLWPLRKNVLMLGATVMHAPDFYPHFLDLMGPIL